jgi:hypothetical protein
MGGTTLSVVSVVLAARFHRDLNAMGIIAAFYPALEKRRHFNPVSGESDSLFAAEA